MKKRNHRFKFILSLASAGLFGFCCLSAPFCFKADASGAFVGEADGGTTAFPGLFYRINSMFDYSVSVVDDDGANLWGGAFSLPSSFSYANGIDADDGYTTDSASDYSGNNGAFRSLFSFVDSKKFEDLSAVTVTFLNASFIWDRTDNVYYTLTLEANNVPMNALWYSSIFDYFDLNAYVSVDGSHLNNEYKIETNLDYLVDNSLSYPKPWFSNFSYSNTFNDDICLSLKNCFPSDKELVKRGALLNDNSYYFKNIRISLLFTLNSGYFYGLSADDYLEVNCRMGLNQRVIYAIPYPVNYRTYQDCRGNIYTYLQSFYTNESVTVTGSPLTPIADAVQGFFDLEILPNFKLSYILMFATAISMVFIFMKVVR